MHDIDEIRRQNLRQIEAEMGGAAEVARQLDMSPAQFINLRSGARDSKTGKRRGMRKETARRIEQALGKPQGWLDAQHAEKAACIDEATACLLLAYKKAQPNIQAAVRMLLTGDQAARI